MPRKTVLEGTDRKHATKEQREAVKRHIEPWKIGKLADYEPQILTNSGMLIFEALVESLPQEVMAKVDGFTIETAADALDKMRMCREKIDTDGLVVQKVNGNGKKIECANDHIAIYAKYSEIAKRFLVELGLTPSARNKVATDAAAAAARPPSLREILAEDDETNGESG